MDLRVLIKECQYPADQEDEMVRDQIVFGVHSSKIREKLINEGSELSYQKTIDISQTYEMTITQCKTMSSKQEVDIVKSRPKQPSQSVRKGSTRSSSRQTRKPPPQNRPQPAKNRKQTCGK